MKHRKCGLTEPEVDLNTKLLEAFNRGYDKACLDLRSSAEWFRSQQEEKTRKDISLLRAQRAKP